jgi:hypothetical protein
MQATIEWTPSTSCSVRTPGLAAPQLPVPLAAADYTNLPAWQQGEGVLRVKSARSNFIVGPPFVGQPTKGGAKEHKTVEDGGCYRGGGGEEGGGQQRRRTFVDELMDDLNSQNAPGARPSPLWAH